MLAFALSLGVSALDAFGSLIADGAIGFVRTLVVIDGEPQQPHRRCCVVERAHEPDEVNW